MWPNWNLTMLNLSLINVNYKKAIERRYLLQNNYGWSGLQAHCGEEYNCLMHNVISRRFGVICRPCSTSNLREKTLNPLRKIIE